MESLRFAAIRAINEVTRQQRDAARLGCFQNANECPLARETVELVVHADEVATGLVVDRVGDLSRGHAGLSEALDGFHVPHRIAPLR